MAEGIYIADARAELDDAAAVIGPSFQVGEKSDDIETIGGLVFAVTGRIPPKGEVVQAVAGFDFEVLDADPRRIKRVRIRDRSKAARAGPAEARRGGVDVRRAAATRRCFVEGAVMPDRLLLGRGQPADVARRGARHAAERGARDADAAEIGGHQRGRLGIGAPVGKGGRMQADTAPAPRYLVRPERNTMAQAEAQERFGPTSVLSPRRRTSSPISSASPRTPPGPSSTTSCGVRAHHSAAELVVRARAR